MLSHRTARILAIVGVVLILVGLFAAWYGSQPASVQDTSPIPPNATGTEYFSEFDFSVLAGGHVAGTFDVVNGTPVTVFVFNDADYSSYVNGANVSGLYTTTAVSGTINVDVSGFGTYRVVFQHAPGYENSTQDVSVDLTSTGLDPAFFLGGMAALVLGAVLVGFGVLRMRTTRPSTPSGILESRATTRAPPAPPSGPDTTPTGSGMYRIPPPLPGLPDNPPKAIGTAATSPAEGAPPTGDVVVTIENRSAATESVALYVNGVSVSTLSLPPGTSQQTSVTARLASPFGSMVTVRAVTSGGRRAEQSVFVGARGTASMSLRIG